MSRLEHALPPSAVTYGRQVAMISGTPVIMAAVAAGAWIAPTEHTLLVAVLTAVAAIVVMALDILVINVRLIRSVRYTIDAQSLRIRRGLLIKQEMELPLRHVISVSIVQGPMLRRLGLAKVRFMTIAQPQVLGPVDVLTAEKIRASVVGVSEGQP
ncbi:PH domain-containing protein [Microbacterium amylolyticum]|uniref:Membrane protein YdbS with pleckstrin-like domain n=1 Tax=Microbacterium amylolyticum TaxID=936337 RepID=A0ABS4ZHZ2_9MICO|nr:PH domain-containing protein [Microbacterium amylolyticum]MBP2436605.1 membrane protein YdbS with pleckstrin-like domain [Microbacterium amylolyticum]